MTTYTVKMNGNYMNNYATYTEAHECVEWLETMYKRATVEIICEKA